MKLYRQRAKQTNQKMRIYKKSIKYVQKAINEKKYNTNSEFLFICI